MICAKNPTNFNKLIEFLRPWTDRIETKAEKTNYSTPSSEEDVHNFRQQSLKPFLHYRTLDTLILNNIDGAANLRTKIDLMFLIDDMNEMEAMIALNIARHKVFVFGDLAANSTYSSKSQDKSIYNVWGKNASYIALR